MFSGVLAFVIFLALESYQRARSEAGVEAVAVTELDRVADAFPPLERARLQGGLVCYARAVIHDEWPAMRAGHESELVEAWVVELGDIVAATKPRNAREEAALGQWLDEEALRRDGRRGRIAEAIPFVPVPLWVVLGLGAFLVLAYMCVQADPREHPWVQGITIGSVAALVVAGLLVVAFLDRPYGDHQGGIRPTEMERTLKLMEREPGRAPPPCNGRGLPAPV